MRRKTGNWLMAVGVMLLLAALSLQVFNEIESKNAGNAARQIQRNLAGLIEQTQNRQNPPGDSFLPPAEIPDIYDTSMTEVEIDGYAYIGCLTVPKLNLELPVMSQWDYDRLRIAPCRVHGTLKTGDLVIAAHNYDSHFGRISRLVPGDEVLFTDMDGVLHRFQVADMEVLEMSDLEGMYAGEYPLTLFTCTYGGKQRIAIRCDAAADFFG